MKLTIWREGDHAFFDWSGTDPQALGPINFYLSEGMFKMFIGIYLIMVNDPQILFNDGFYPLLHVVMPEGIAAAAALPGRARLPHARARAAVRRARRRALQAGAGAEHGRRLRHEPVHALLGLGREGRVLLLDGDPLRRHPRPADRRRDGRPLVVAAVREHPDGVPRGVLPDADRRLHDGDRLRRRRLPPRRQRRREALRLPRAGRGLDPRRPLADAALGRARRRARRALEKILRRADGTEELLPSKCDNVVVEPGDMLVYRTAGGGGWKDRLDRPAESSPATSRSGSSSPRRRGPATASSSRDDGAVDVDATEAERARQRDERGEALAFDFGPPLEEVLAALQGRDRARAAGTGEAAALVAARGGRRGARARARGDGIAGAVSSVRHDGLSRARRASAGAPPCS